MARRDELLNDRSNAVADYERSKRRAEQMFLDGDRAGAKALRDKALKDTRRRIDALGKEARRR